jgi:predicted regulator of Ras-like GTPase activity (Roadblock/LC7/MglB family)
MPHPQVAKLEEVLDTLREVDGVEAAMVVDHAGEILAQLTHRSLAIYDVSRLQRVGRAMASSADASRLLQDDWELLVTEFGDRKLVLRSVPFAGVRPRSCVLAVIGDAALNLAFLAVALRVAASKLRTELEAAPAASVVEAPDAPAVLTGPPVSSITARLPLPPPPVSDLVDAGLTWSGTAPSSVGSSLTGDVGVSDSASSTFLSACTRALGASVGPMAKVFVKEAVRRICGERPFSRADGMALIAQLAAGIDDTEDRALFERATRSL